MPNQSAAIQVSGKPEQGPFYNLDGFQLPAAGAFTAQSYSDLPPQARRAHVVVTFTGGAGSTNGAGRFRVQWRIQAGPTENVVTDVYEAVLDGTTIAKSGAFLENPEYAYSIAGPIAAPATAFNFKLLSIEVPIFATGMRIIAAEGGDTAHPGQVTIRIYTSDKL